MNPIGEENRRGGRLPVGSANEGLPLGQGGRNLGRDPKVSWTNGDKDRGPELAQTSGRGGRDKWVAKSRHRDKQANT